MDLIILAMDNVIFQDLDLLLTIISLILNTFHVLKKWMEENFYYSRDIQHKILNDILKMPSNVNVRTFGIKRSTLIILFLIFFNFFFSLGPKKIKTLKKIHKVLLRYKKDDI